VNDARWFLLVTFMAFILGVRGSWRLARRYRDVSGELIRRERLLLGAIVAVAVIITIAAAVFAFLSARRVLGFEALEWTPGLTLFMATLILLIPAGLDYVVGLVARVPWK
jgi:hypothetical protein